MIKAIQWLAGTKASGFAHKSRKKTSKPERILPVQQQKDTIYLSNAPGTMSDFQENSG